MKITISRLRELLVYEPNDGSFRWVSKANRKIVIGSVAGTLLNGRTRITIDGEFILAHRLAWFYTHGVWPENEIDHINGDPLDNRISNLRDVTHQVNLQNRVKPAAHNKSGFLGVHWYAPSKSWRSMIRTNGKSKNLGYFSTPEEAHYRYVIAKRESHFGNTL